VDGHGRGLRDPRRDLSAPGGDAGDDESIDEARIHDLLDLPTVMAVDALLVEKWSRDALEMILSFDHPDFPPSRLKGLDGDELCA
jgi:hypothetical protein